MDSWTSCTLTYRPTERVQIRCACRPIWRDRAARTDHETAHSQHTGNEILTPGRVGRRCSVHQVDPGWGYLWCYLSVPLGWPPAPPRCAGRVGSHLTAISGLHQQRSPSSGPHRNHGGRTCPDEGCGTASICHGVQDAEHPTSSGRYPADQRRLKLSDIVSSSSSGKGQDPDKF